MSHRSNPREEKVWQQALRARAEALPGLKPYESRRPMRVGERFHAMTLREFLTLRFPHVEWPLWKEVVDDGHIRRGTTALRAEDRVRAGDQLAHVRPAMVEPVIATGIDVIFADEHILGLAKPAPLPVHPSGRYFKHALTTIIAEARPEAPVWVVHRLDADTTGVLIFARNRDAARDLCEQFRKGEPRKIYLARVSGEPSSQSFECDAPIAPGTGRGGMKRSAPDGLPSRTRFDVIARLGGGTTLLRVTPITGRTHQITLHLRELGFPIIGDHAYSDAWSEHHASSGATARLEPHAFELTIRHPGDTMPLVLRAPAPEWAAVSRSEARA